MAELIPCDTLGHKGKVATLTPYVDANLYHDWITVRSATGMLHSVNVTPIERYLMCQSTVETNYGPEPTMAVHTSEQQVIDLHNYAGEIIDPRFVGSYHMPEECNPADILVKHWGYWLAWQFLQPLF